MCARRGRGYNLVSLFDRRILDVAFPASTADHPVFRDNARRRSDGQQFIDHGAVMFQFGIDEKVAVATNMFGLTLSRRRYVPFVRRGNYRPPKNYRRWPR